MYTCTMYLFSCRFFGEWLRTKWKIPFRVAFYMHYLFKLAFCLASCHRFTIYFFSLDGNIAHKHQNWHFQRHNLKFIPNARFAQNSHVDNSSVQTKCDELFILSIYILWVLHMKFAFAILSKNYSLNTIFNFKFFLLLSRSQCN